MLPHVCSQSHPRGSGVTLSQFLRNFSSSGYPVLFCSPQHASARRFFFLSFRKIEFCFHPLCFPPLLLLLFKHTHFMPTLSWVYTQPAVVSWLPAWQPLLSAHHTASTGTDDVHTLLSSAGRCTIPAALLCCAVGVAPDASPAVVLAHALCASRSALLVPSFK